MTTSPQRSAGLKGWPIVGWSSLLIVALVAAVLAVRGDGDVGLRTVIRTTAFTSLLLFSGAFTASSLHQAWPSPSTRWLLQNRRYLGVSFAASHFVHLAAIVALASTAPTFRLQASTAILGGLAYVFIVAMTATSFDRTAAWLGPRAWRALHRTGVYYIWLIFLLTYLPRLAQAPLYGFMVAVLLAGIGARGLAFVRRRRSPPLAPPR
jgi:sulfoxide reductase heme-binding subunit YedZ